MELYKKHRPTTLNKVVGNDETVAALSKMLEQGTLPHAILFSGPSGTGKTTLARILKTELECGDLDFHEINSASFRGIDSVRDIQRNMNLAPVTGKCRIWLIDECHKLTADAMQASLKILEDTPSHVYFFLCTTEPKKLIPAILTRCCDMPVRSLTYNELEYLCDKICKRENITLDKDVKDELVASAQGSARLLLVLLDKIANLDSAQQKDAIKAKLESENAAIDLCRALINKAKWREVSAILKNLTSDVETTRWAVLGYARAVLLSKGDWDSYNVIKAFENPFYESKEAGLAAACYEAINAKE